MSRTIQIRNVPEAVHDRLKTRAGRAGKSLSAFLREEISRLAGMPTPEEMQRRLRSRDRVKLTEAASVVIRAQRGPLP